MSFSRAVVTVQTSVWPTSVEEWTLLVLLLLFFSCVFALWLGRRMRKAGCRAGDHTWESFQPLVSWNGEFSLSELTWRRCVGCGRIWCEVPYGDSRAVPTPFDEPSVVGGRFDA